MHLCLIIPITEHPAFMRARSLRFRHDGGNIIARTDWGDEHLTHEQAHDEMHRLKARIAAGHRAGQELEAAMTASDLRELEAAWQDLQMFWRVAS